VSTHTHRASHGALACTEYSASSRWYSLPHLRVAAADAAAAAEVRSPAAAAATAAPASPSALLPAPARFLCPPPAREP
jgi:hypothetical protein